MSFKEKLSEAEKFRAEGNELYKAGDFKKAIGKYHRAILYIKAIQSDFQGTANPFTGETPKSKASDTNENRKALNDITVPVYNNLAAALISADKNYNAEKVLEYVNTVLDIDNRNEKAWHRKGLALMKLKRFSEAHEAFTKSGEMSGGKELDKKTKSLVKFCEQHMVQELKDEAEMCRKMFS